MNGILRFLFTAAVSLWLVLRIAPAGAEGELTVDIDSVDDSSVPEVRAVVNILDAAGRPVPNLGPQNFLVSINGETLAAADVRAAVNSDIGVAVVITVDVSGSMKGASLQQAQAAARTFVEGLAPIDSVALLTFSDTVTAAQAFTTDRGQLLAAIAGLKAAGNTALFQAMSVSAYLAAAAENQRKAIILLSDGLDYGGKSAVSRNDSIAQARQVGAPVFAVGLGQDIDRQYLTELAQATGGRFLETPTPEGLSALFRDIGDFLRSQYVVTVRVENLDRSQPLAFHLEVRSGDLTGRASLSLEPREPAPEPPTVVLTGLSAGAQVEDPITLGAQVSSGADLESVTFLVDGAEVQTFTTPPFQMLLDPHDYPDGEHVVRVEVRDVRGRTAAADARFVIAAPAASKESPGWRLLVGVVVVAGLLGVAGFVLVRARRRRGAPARGLETRVKPWSGRSNGDKEASFAWSGSEPVRIEDQPLGRLIVTSGPRAGEAFEVGARPRRIGAAPYCDIVLGDDEGRVAPEEARVWVSEGRLMYHKIRRLTSLAVDGPSGDWLILAPGDELAIGPFQLIFELTAAEEPSLEESPAPEAAPQPSTTAKPPANPRPRADGPADS